MRDNDSEGWMEKRSQGETRPLLLDEHFLIRSVVKEIVNDSHKAGSAEKNEAMNGFTGHKVHWKSSRLALTSATGDKQ